MKGLARFAAAVAMWWPGAGLGSPFPAPTGIVDYAFRKPGDVAALSVLGALNQWGNAALEGDANLPLAKGLPGPMI